MCIHLLKKIKQFVNVNLQPLVFQALVILNTTFIFKTKCLGYFFKLKCQKRVVKQ